MAGSGAGMAGVAEGAMEVVPRALRTSLRSVRSMVGAPSKLPEVQAVEAVPRLLRTMLRSLRSTLPSSLASPASARTKKETVSAVLSTTKLPVTPLGRS